MCVSLVPIRIVPASPALPVLAMSTLLEPVVRFWPAFRPMATLADPVAWGGGGRASIPAATLLLPVVLSSALGQWRRCRCRWCWRRAPGPGGDVVVAGGIGKQRVVAGGELTPPGVGEAPCSRRRCCSAVVLEKSATRPDAVFWLPDVLEDSAWSGR